MNTVAQTDWSEVHVPVKEATESLQAVGLFTLQPGLMFVPNTCPDAVCMFPQSRPAAAPLIQLLFSDMGSSVAGKLVW
jgi:hypothetical protein